MKTSCGDNESDIMKLVCGGRNTPSGSHTGSNEICFKELGSDDHTTGSRL